MDKYILQSDESVIYKAHVFYRKVASASTELLLTNTNIVLIMTINKIFSKPQSSVEIYPLTDVKIYKDIPQIKQKDTIVEIYLTTGEIALSFASKLEAHKFTNAAYELITGKSASVRGADKVKSAINLVDNTLGINTVDTVKNAIENGITGTLLGGLGKKTTRAEKNANAVRGLLDVAKAAVNKNNSPCDASSSTEQTSISEVKASMSYDEQIDAINKMKSLLDAGVLTQEEFDLKKKEILGL